MFHIGRNTAPELRVGSCTRVGSNPHSNIKAWPRGRLSPQKMKDLIIMEVIFMTLILMFIYPQASPL